MKRNITFLGITCALALAACGGDDSAPARDPAPPATPPATSAPPATTAPPASTPPRAAAPSTQAPATTTQDADAKPAAVVSDCGTTIEGNDAMQFNVGSITVPASCSEFTITLEHTGQLPVAAMGHNVVISLASDREPIARDSAPFGLDADYVKPDDDRVIAHTEMIGGGETTSVTFPVEAIQGAGPYEFFCSFPGHWVLMRGTIQVE